MLLTRVLSGIVMLAIVLAMTFCTTQLWFEVTFGVLLLMGAWEWARLVNVQQWALRFWYVVVLAAAMLTLTLTRFHFHCVWLASVFWLYAIFLVISYQQHKAPSLSSFRWFHGLMGWIVLLGAWSALITLRHRPHGTYWVLGSMLIVWVMDTFAYFSGRLFGRHRLCTHVSPKKSIEGLLGGLICLMLLYVWVSHYFTAQHITDTAPSLLTVMLTGFLSVFGDLFESVLKREAGLKDSGNLIPGHGGVLDRLDALLLGVTVFVSLLNIAWLNG